MDFEQIIIEQLVTEKSVAERAHTRYTFKVNPLARKIEIRQAVEKMFKVKVQDVNTCYVRPRSRSMGKSRGRTSRWKKAYVTLARGQKIQELEG